MRHMRSFPRSNSGRSHLSGRLRFQPGVSFVLFAILLAVLWVAGGGSRADLVGQVLVRAAAWVLLIVAILFAPTPSWRSARPVAALLFGAAAIACLQLVPLPPGLWQMLPGRSVLAEAAAASSQPQPWRAWSMVPGATLNALSSLIVPLAVLVLVTGMRSGAQRYLPATLLGFAALAMLIGLLQFSGAALNNPFVNDTSGEVSGILANRNHFALLMAIGCSVAPGWAFMDRAQLRWRGPLAGGLVLVFLLAIVASGSRSGVILGAVALLLGLITIAQPARHLLRRQPRWVFPAILSGVAVLAVALVAISVLAGRAVAIDRIVTSEVGQDMRSRGLPTVLGMVRDYLPFGSGLGGFDTLFRMHEPFGLLKPTYFNHAHNDWLEIVLDAGIPGLLLLLSGVLWWGMASMRAWRGDALMPKIGSTAVLLVMVASVFDYPARTPAIMAILTLGALWLAGVGMTSALPRTEQHL